MFPIFDKKEDIPKGFEADYVERDGKWHPQVDAGAELKATLKKEREAREAAEKAAKKADEDRAAAERKLAAADSGDEKDRVAKALAKFDADKVAADAKHKVELDTVSAELRTLKLDDKIKAAALAGGVLPTKVDAVLKLTKDRFDLEGDRIVVKNEQGETTTEKVEDFFVKTYRGQMPELYAGTRAAGGGAGGGARTGTASPGRMTPDEIVANPREAVRRANAEAVAA